ncbi:MAG: DUF6338 family protein [Rhodospirillaceae bacterium]|nr:DUF6338 family protein [Rhodospirillaceae bacterium]
MIAILTYLLPGLVAAATFYALTSHPKPGTFERIVQALIFTVLAQIIADQLPLDDRPQSWHIIASVGSAIFLALLATYLSNNDTMHRILRKLRVTKETSLPSEWYSAFARKDPRYVILHLKDRRRIYGWPEEWPGQPDRGHFRIAEPEWLDAENTKEESKEEASVEWILIAAEDVRMVEFLPEHRIK